MDLQPIKIVQLPLAFIRSLQTVKGFDEETFKAVHESGAQLTSVRFNPAKFKIHNSQFKIGSIPWSHYGYYLPERPSFTLDPLFHAGAYYVQEASSMFLEEVLKQTVDLSQPLRVLDCCAAPGGKSTLIQSLISKDSLLVSNEVIKPRVNVLAENMTKWGSANVIVSNNDPRDFQRLDNYFDAIVVDAPCSGSGLFRKDPSAIEEWSENNVQLCSQRQQRILANIIPALKEGGVLIYSTCSYSKEEDETICDWMSAEFKVESLKLKVGEDWGIVETVSETEKTYGYRFYPDKVKGEGFFIAAFRKPGAGSRVSGTGRSKNKVEKVIAKEIEILKPYLKDPTDLFFIKQKEDILAIPAELEKELYVIQSVLYIKKAGVKLGTIIRDELIPNHELALSTIINSSVAQIEVDRDTALQYLRREDIQLPSAQKGWALLTYQQLPLGWVKILSNRVNNYYPREWRILNK